ncbi:MAG: adenylate/guanylate cyclase domain-containing protein, partial [Candidatus Fermentibacteraceae bacterium]|nr:adenylate/guanylate cyclase domain-containing protein [Candidatus Fermentibacteraceae bacterium]
MSYAPLMIKEMTRKGVVSGSFSGAVLLADIIGFTSRFERMTGLGAEGAELISREVSSTLSAVASICAEFRGFPVSFAGDAVTIVFPGGLKDASLAAQKINLLAGGEFLPLRSSIGEGQVVWDAIPMDGWTFYSFQGAAVRQALLPGQGTTLEQKPWSGQKYECVPVGSEDLPANGFISPELFADGIKNEFRQVINIFLSLENRSGNNCPREFQELVLNTAEEVGGFVSGLEAGKEDYHI